MKIFFVGQIFTNEVAFPYQNRNLSSLHNMVCCYSIYVVHCLVFWFSLIFKVWWGNLFDVTKFMETKTKFMGFGMTGQFAVCHNGNVIRQVEEYKYLGTIIRPIKRWNQDVFYKNYSFICDKSRKAIFGLQEKLNCVKALTPEIRFDIFDTMIRPIITYGSDVWGLCKSGLHDLDKSFLNYIRCVLCIKATTSNIIVYGECGKFPPRFSDLDLQSIWPGHHVPNWYEFMHRSFVIPV